MNQLETLRRMTLERKFLGSGLTTRAAKTSFGKARRSITPEPGRAGESALGRQARLQRAEKYLGRRAKREAKKQVDEIAIDYERNGIAAVLRQGFERALARKEPISASDLQTMKVSVGRRSYKLSKQQLAKIATDAGLPGITPTMSANQQFAAIKKHLTQLSTSGAYLGRRAFRTGQ